LKKNEKTEGYNESKKLKEHNEWKRYKKQQGKANFLWDGKNCLHGSEKEKKLSLFKSYYEGKGKMEKDNGERKLEKEKLKRKTKASRKVKAKRKKIQCK